MEIDELSQSIQELESKQNYFKQLDMFNKNLLNGNDFFSRISSDFQQWLYHLQQIAKEVMNKFNPNSSNLFQISTYEECCSTISKIFTQAILNTLQDRTASTAFKQMHNLLVWVLNASLIYSNFHPSFSGPTNGALLDAVSRKYSDIIMELSDNMDTAPEDLSQLRYIPSDFPHHLIAYSLLLCRLTAEENDLMYQNANITAQVEADEIRLKFPEPYLLETNEDFIKARYFYSHLKEQVTQSSSKLQIALIPLKETLQKTQQLLSQLQFKDFMATWENLNFYYHEKQKNKTEFLILNHHYHFYNSIKDIDFLGIINNYFNPIQEFLFWENSHLNSVHSFTSGPLKPLIDRLPENKAKIKEAIEALKQIDSLLSKKIEEMPSPQFHIDNQQNLHNQRKDRESKVDTQRQIVITAPEQLNNLFCNITDQLDAFCRTFESLTAPDLIDKQTVVSLAVSNLTKMKEAFEELIQQKKIELDILRKKLEVMRHDIDVIETTNKHNKTRITAPETLCKDCEESRSVTIVSCGHSFCERCIREAQNNIPMICPYCQKPFTPKDIITIAWN